MPGDFTAHDVAKHNSALCTLQSDLMIALCIVTNLTQIGRDRCKIFQKKSLRFQIHVKRACGMDCDLVLTV